MKTVDSTMRLERASRKDVIALIDGLRAQQDIPCSAVDVSEVSDAAMEIRFRYPLDVFDRSVSQFMAVLFGEFPFMRSFAQVKFTDLRLPEEVFGWFRGPRFGIDGVRQRFDLAEFPFLMAIVKPSMGLDLPALEERISGPLRAGFHAVKDDEMQGNTASLPLASRLELAVRHRGYIPTVNLDSLDAIRSVLSREDLSMVLVNATITGFPMLHEMSKLTNVPLLSHLSMQGTYAATFDHGVFALLHRLFGCDAMITPIGDAGYYRASKAEEQEMVGTLVNRELPIRPTLPLLTGGARLHNVEEVIRPYRVAGMPHGVVFGNQVYQSEHPPEEMARAIRSRIAKQSAG